VVVPMFDHLHRLGLQPFLIFKHTVLIFQVVFLLVAEASDFFEHS
jgi:hypothetical protein